MAESSVLDKLLGFLKGFLSSMPSPIEGFSMNDVKVKEEGDVFSSLFSFSAGVNEDVEYAVGDDTITRTGQGVKDIGGNDIDVYILLKALNARDVFNPILSGLNQLNSLDDKEKAALFTVLLGDEREDDLTVAGAKSREEGLLGINLISGSGSPFKYKTAPFNGQSWSWGDIADDALRYGLECQSPGAAYGAITNVPLTKCEDLIKEYLVDTAKAIATADEVQIDIMDFVKPILLRMQAWLVKYYEAAIQKYNPDNVKNPDSWEDEKLKDPNMIEIFEPTDNGLQSTGESYDKTTPDGVAKIKEYASHGYVGEGGASLMDLITSSRHISAKLRKIQGSIDLLALESNYSPSDTLDDLEDIIYQDEFLDTLTEEPQAFDISVDNEGYDIEQCENCEIDPCAGLCEVFKSGIRAYRNLYILHWMAKGNDMMKLHLMTEDMYEELQGEIDTIGELLVEKQGTVPQLDFPCDYLPIQEYDFQTGLSQIKSLIQMYIDCIDYAYCNQDSDVQSTLDEWLRYWNKQLNYFVKGQEI